MKSPPYQSISNSCFSISPNFYTPTSTTNLVFELSIRISTLLGKGCWSIDDYFVLLSAIYFIGTWNLFKLKYLNWKLQLSLIFLPVFFSFFLKSLYEESILLALIPIFILSTFSYLKQGNIFLFSIVSSLILLTKFQLIALLPALLFFAIKNRPRKNLSIIKIGFVVLVLLTSCYYSVSTKQSSGDNLANSYNRFFNGIGWSMQEVRHWPADEFSERLAYFNENRHHIQEITYSNELIENESLWGTSYWPTGLELLTSGNDSRWQAIERYLSPEAYVSYLLSQPNAFLKYLTNSVSIFISSDYSLTYLKDSKDDLSSLERIIYSINLFFMQLIIVLYIMLLAIILFSRSGIGRMIGISLLLISPFIVASGDGFFEYEKHLMPYFITLPLLLVLIQKEK